MLKSKSPEVLILSKHAESYHSLIQSGLPQVVLHSTHTLEEARRYSHSSVLLAEPNLGVEILAAMPELKWYQSTWAGVTPLMAQGLRKDYLLTGVKDVFGPLISEYVLAYILLFERHILEHRAAQKAKTWHPVLPGRLHGKTVGITGTGSIAQYLAQTLKPFGLKIKGYNTRGQTTAYFDTVYSQDDLPTFLAGCDYVVNTLPDTPQTYHLFNAHAFKGMPDHTLFINVGRGNAVDENALIKALEQNQLKAAILDVFSQEPLANHHPFWENEKIWISSHTAAPSFPEDIAKIFMRNYGKFISGETLDYLIDFEKGY